MTRMLKQSVQASDRSADIARLHKDYQVMKARLEKLLPTLKRYKRAMAEVDALRMDVFEQLSTLSGASDGGAVHQDAKDQSKFNMALYQDSVIEFVAEWHDAITTRIDAEYSKREQLSKTHQHYETKVAALRAKVENKKANETKVPEPLQEKLDRNEEKLHQAWMQHEECTGSLVQLLEEATRRGWKDIMPLADTMFDFESRRNLDDRIVIAKIQSSLMKGSFSVEQDEDAITLTIDENKPKSSLKGGSPTNDDKNDLIDWEEELQANVTIATATMSDDDFDNSWEDDCSLDTQSTRKTASIEHHDLETITEGKICVFEEGRKSKENLDLSTSTLGVSGSHDDEYFV